MPIIPIYCQEIGITGSKIGIILTSMSVTTVLFHTFAGYILDNFNRYHVYILFLALFSLPFLEFVWFPIFAVLVAGMLLSKLSTQRMIDTGRHNVLVAISLLILIVTMGSYFFMEHAIHLLLAGFLFGLGYGILQPLFQSFVTGTTPPHKRGTANATDLLPYDIGIGIGSLLMGFCQDSIGLAAGFALTGVVYIAGGVIYALYVNHYYNRLFEAAMVAITKGKGIDE